MIVWLPALVSQPELPWSFQMGPQRFRAAHPDVSQTLLEQDRGDGGGGHVRQGRDRFGGQGHR